MGLFSKRIDGKTAEECDEALIIARSIRDESSRSDALRGIAPVPAYAEKFDEALNIARSISNEFSRSDALGEIASALANAGKFDEALNIARSIPESHRSGALERIVWALAYAEKFDEALNIAKSIRDESSYRKMALGEIASALANAGKFDEALKIARSITVESIRLEDYVFPQDLERSFALKDIASALANAGKFDEALKIARSISNESSRSRALEEIASALANAGDPSYKQIFDEALKIARNISYESSRSTALREIASALANAGDPSYKQIFDEALKTARNIRNRISTPDLLTPGEVLKNMINIRYGSSRSTALREIASALMNTGDPSYKQIFDEALKTARSISDESSRSIELEIVWDLADAGKFDEALKIARSIGEESCRSEELRLIASALANAGDPSYKQIFDEALKTARRVSNESSRSKELGMIGWALANAGDPSYKQIFDEALRTAKRVSDESSRSEGLKNITRAFTDVLRRKNILERIENGENAFGSGDIEKALNLYKQALNLSYYCFRSTEIVKKLQLNERIEKAKKHKQSLKTIHSILDTAKSLYSQANELFHKKKYPEALKAYENTLTHFNSVQEGATSLNDTELIGSISNNISAVQKNITACKNAIGAEIASKARSKFEEDDFERDAQAYKAEKLLVLREFEFFNGFIRLKLSVKNKTQHTVTDVFLDLDVDENILRLDHHEPETYAVKKGKIQLGNILPNNDRTIALYLDPLICAKEGTDINARVDYKDAYGKPESVRIEPLRIKVVCPIFQTEKDINIGRLKELVVSLPAHGSKVFSLPKGSEIGEAMALCREVIQMHDVRHVRTFKTTDSKTYETWYYGKTKVERIDLVIKANVSKETESIEVFVAAPDQKALTGLLAELGRNLTKRGESLGKLAPQLNLTIKDSIIQRSKLLDFCDFNGICGANVVIEDSLVQRSEIV